MTFILGSASPRRRELLARIGIVPDRITQADIDETPQIGECPTDYVRRLAHEKSQEIDIAPAEVLLTADTVVAVGRRILGKPADIDQARHYLQLLSGRRHRVMTAIYVRKDERRAARLVQTSVKMKRLSEEEIASYLASDEWQGKAGGYAIQGRAEAFIPMIIGSYSNVVGLPLNVTAGLLAGMGVRADAP